MGLGEILIILAIALVLFGPEDLPEIARKLGKIVYQVRKASNEFSREFKNTMDIPANVMNKALEQTPSSAPSKNKKMSDSELGERKEEEVKGESENGRKDKEPDEELLTYENEDSGKKKEFIKEDAPDPLSELPSDMVYYEEKGASR